MAGAVLFGWLPCWSSLSACLPGRAEQAARCPLAVCGFGDLLTLPLPEAVPSLDSFLIHAVDEKTEGDIAGRGTEGERGYFCVVLSMVFYNSFLKLPA